MDYVIVLALVVTAGAMLFGKPLRIEIVHKIDQPQHPAISEEEQKKIDEEQENTTAKQSMSAVLKAVHDIMGVNDDDHRTT